VLDFEAVTTNRLFCFVGNPYTGFKIYNAAAGSSYTLCSTGESDEITMAEGEYTFMLHGSDTNSDKSKYFTLKPSAQTYYLNFDYNNERITGWKDADNGSTCWVVAPGQYYIDFIDALYLDAPVGAVGTNSYFPAQSNPTSALSTIKSLRSDITSYMYSNVLGSVNGMLTPIKAYSTITLSDGYYRVISAVPGFNNAAAWYYNPSVSTDHITWAKAATTAEHQVNSIFKFTANADKWNIYSPNAQSSLIADGTAFQAQTAAIGAEAGDITIENVSSSIQYTLKINFQTVHCNGHSDGNGTSGTLINYNANGAGQASTWYLQKVSSIDISLNDGGDGYYYATMCLPFDVTISGADAYTLSVSGNYAVPAAVPSNQVPAGTPVLLKGNSTNAVATINTGAAFNGGEPLTCKLTGTFVDLDVSSINSSAFFLGLAGEPEKIGFYHWEGTTLKANRAYLTASDAVGVKGFVLDFDDDATAIDEVNGQWSTVNGQPIYNLAGQRLNKIQKGINIVNGKKVLR
jgi:hypothetical protein